MRIHPNPESMIKEVGQSLLSSKAKVINPKKWQGLDISHKMVECFDNVIRCQIPQSRMFLEEYTGADMPWAEDHFQERIAGFPTNPGNTFKDWPYYQENEYRKDDIFTHTYQERFWPKKAGSAQIRMSNNQGIRFELGDLSDTINHLGTFPDSRQAFLPIWFPEDTGVVHKGRVPCTIGYLFSYRDGFLHMTYYLRSCDYIRHFKNDVYLACRLLQYVLDQLRGMISEVDWAKVKPGRLKMDIESLHIFETDLYELKKRLK